MLYSMLSPVVFVWNSWAGLFATIPYAPNIVAALVLSIFVIGVFYLSFRFFHRWKKNIRTPEVQLLETYRRVMNLR